MKKFFKILVVYFPVLWVFLILLGNLTFLFFKDFYIGISFYANQMIGINFLVAIYFLARSYIYRFCSITKVCSFSMIIMGLVYLVIKEDNLYNITLQIIVCFLALLITALLYTKKFPRCTLSMIKNFFNEFIKTCSCSMALENWKQNLEKDIRNENDGIKY